MALQRPETESTYLEHQSRVLRRLHPDRTLKPHWERLDVGGFYDEIAMEFHDDHLWPAYEALYRRDKPHLSPIVLRSLGLKALASIWCDSGLRYPDVAFATFYANFGQQALIEHWTSKLKLPACSFRGPRRRQIILRWQGRHATALNEALRPLMHKTMHHTLDPADPTAASPYAAWMDRDEGDGQ